MTEAYEQRLADLGTFISDQRRLARLSVRKLSELAGISNPYLSQIERGLRKPSADILQQLAKALRISAESLYVKAGILDPSAEDEVTAAIVRSTRLRQDQKTALTRIYVSFLRENDIEAGPVESPVENAG